VQLQKPLTLLHVALASRKILNLSRIHQEDFEPMLFEDVIQWNPIEGIRQSNRICSAG
jgi:hypothetical protein